MIKWNTIYWYDIQYNVELYNIWYDIVEYAKIKHNV